MEKYNYLLGFVSLQLFLTMVFFATIGITLSLLWDGHKRNPDSPNTPQKFSFWFLLKDNWRTIIATILLVLVTIRFATSFFPNQFKGDEVVTPEGIEKWLFGSLLIGLAWNQLAQFLKKKIPILNVER
jgi:hypothetical protein